MVLVNVIDCYGQVETNFVRVAVNMHHIQGVPGGMCQTSGECSLGQTIPI